MANLLNFFLSADIYDRDFTRLCALLRAGEIKEIDQGTWETLADHLEGKLKRKRGRKIDPAISARNEQAWEYHRELTGKGLTYDGALDAMAAQMAEYCGGEAEALRGRIKGWIEGYSRLKLAD